MWAIHVMKETLDALDTMDESVSDFEANLLETVTRQIHIGRLPSPQQHRILCAMVEKYLDDPALLRALQDETPLIRKESHGHEHL